MPPTIDITQRGGRGSMRYSKNESRVSGRPERLTPKHPPCRALDALPRIRKYRKRFDFVFPLRRVS